MAGRSGAGRGGRVPPFAASAGGAIPADPGTHVPPPPPDLAARPLPVERLAAGTLVYRITWEGQGALWFGPAIEPDGRRRPRNRFDDPDGAYGVCYLGCTREAAFVETFLRDPPVRDVSKANADRRKLATVRLRRDLEAVRLHSKGPPAVGTTAAVASGSHGPARRWSRALFEHPSAPGGLLYRARHDDSLFCLAAYDRAADALEVVDERPLRADRAWFGGLLDAYDLGLED